MEKTTITLDRDVHKELMLFKIQTDAKNLSDVLRILIPKLQKELEQLNKQEEK